MRGVAIWARRQWKLGSESHGLPLRRGARMAMLVSRRLLCREMIAARPLKCDPDRKRSAESTAVPPTNPACQARVAAEATPNDLQKAEHSISQKEPQRMPSGVEEMRAATNAAEPRLPPAEARDLIDEGNVLIVDVRGCAGAQGDR
jgi:uncharacterized membrane protein